MVREREKRKGKKKKGATIGPDPIRVSIIIIKHILKKPRTLLRMIKKALQREKLPPKKSEKSLQGPLSVFNLAQAPSWRGAFLHSNLQRVRKRSEVVSALFGCFNELPCSTESWVGYCKTAPRVVEQHIELQVRGRTEAGPCVSRCRNTFSAIHFEYCLGWFWSRREIV